MLNTVEQKGGTVYLCDSSLETGKQVSSFGGHRRDAEVLAQTLTIAGKTNSESTARTMPPVMSSLPSRLVKAREVEEEPQDEHGDVREPGDVDDRRVDRRKELPAAMVLNSLASCCTSEPKSVERRRGAGVGSSGDSASSDASRAN